MGDLAGDGAGDGRWVVAMMGGQAGVRRAIGRVVGDGRCGRLMVSIGGGGNGDEGDG